MCVCVATNRDFSSLVFSSCYILYVVLYLFCYCRLLQVISSLHLHIWRTYGRLLYSYVSYGFARWSSLCAIERERGREKGRERKKKKERRRRRVQRMMRKRVVSPNQDWISNRNIFSLLCNAVVQSESNEKSIRKCNCKCTVFGLGRDRERGEARINRNKMFFFSSHSRLFRHRRINNVCLSACRAFFFFFNFYIKSIFLWFVKNCNRRLFRRHLICF